MTTALLLTGDVTKIWPLLEETSFEDNGGEPDGNAWLSVEYDQQEADRVSAAGLGKMVTVRDLSDRQLAAFLGIRLLEDGWEDDETVFDSWKMQLNERSGGWAHYGAYGVADSRWIVQI